MPNTPSNLVGARGRILKDGNRSAPIDSKNKTLPKINNSAVSNLFSNNRVKVNMIPFHEQLEYRSASELQEELKIESWTLKGFSE